MTTDPVSSPPRPERGAASPIRDKLSAEQIARMREWVEGSTRSFKRIGQELGVSASTVSRYAAEGGWRRPPGSPRPARIARKNPEPIRRRKPAQPLTGDQRERIREKLWRLAERHAEELEDQPIELAQRSLQPLARLTRMLGEMDKHIRPPLLPETYEIDAPKPRRTINELRDELVAHLERIEREEGKHWDIREWWFKDGEGI